MSFTAHDIDADKTLVRMRENITNKNYISVITNWLVYWILLWKEYHICRQSKFVITMAYRDYVRQAKRKVNVHFIPPFLHPVKANHTFRKPPPKPTLAVLGHLSFSAAGRGAEMFLNKVAPKVKEKIPDSEIKIIGKGLSKELISRCHALDVLYQDYVDDLEELWNEITVLASPLLVAKGIRIRILEAAYRGIPVVCTEHSSTGFCDPKKFLRTAKDFDDFADHCIDLLSNADSYNKEQVRIQKYFNENLSAEIIKSKWEQIWMNSVQSETAHFYSDKNNKILSHVTK
jgi:glycosyltransferase involved in cell wall biosynthesis